MKRLILLFLVAGVAGSSCKKDSQPGTDTLPAATNVLPVNLRSVVDGEAEEYQLIYVPGTKKLARVMSGNWVVQEYEYDGDFVRKVLYSSSDYQEYEYENNKLVREIGHWAGEDRHKTEYTYLAGNKVKIAAFRLENGDWKEEMSVQIDLDAKGNMTKATNAGVSATLTYDTKGTPFLNVTGYTDIHFLGGLPLGSNVDYIDLLGRKNNPLSADIRSGDETFRISYNYEFADTGSPDFPTKISGRVGEKDFAVTVSYTRLEF